LHGTEGNRAVLNGAALVYFPRFYGVIGIRRDGLGRYSANCKTVYTSSILVVASTIQINDLVAIFEKQGARAF
jgi:hypothetical protein